MTLPKIENINAFYNKMLSVNLSAFIEKSFTHLSPNNQYLHNWHIDAICDYLNAVEAGDVKKLIINMPPRFLKSIAVSQAWTAYLLGRNPATQIIVASYSSSLSCQLSVATRELIRSDWYKKVFPELKLADDLNRQEWFKTNQNGHRYATSVGGTITGFGGDYLILDDPVNPADAMSDTMRVKANQWVGSSFLNRANNPKTVKMVCVMQRLHDNDVSGYLEGLGDCEILKLPVQFEAKTFIQTPTKQYELEAGEFLHEERIGKKEADSLKTGMGSYSFAGQYMQNPAPTDGGIVKKAWIKPIITKPLSYDAIYHSWDTASKANAGSDFSALTVWGVHQNRFYLLFTFNKQMEFPELKQSVIKYANMYKPDTILLEDKSSGIALAQDLIRNTALPIITITPIKDKITRLSNVSQLFEQGRILIDAESDWAESYCHQLTTFPNAIKDDLVDSTSQFLNYVKFKSHDNNYDYQEDFYHDNNYQGDNVNVGY
jgi:predicted phage terminase large subunit-like protein